MSGTRRPAPGDLRAALALFSRAGAAFDALDDALRDAAIAWIEAAPPGPERADRVVEVAVRANTHEIGALLAQQGLRPLD